MEAVMDRTTGIMDNHNHSPDYVNCELIQPQIPPKSKTEHVGQSFVLTAARLDKNLIRYVDQII